MYLHRQRKTPVQNSISFLLIYSRWNPTFSSFPNPRRGPAPDSRRHHSPALRGCPSAQGNHPSSCSPAPLCSLSPSMKNGQNGLLPCPGKLPIPLQSSVPKPTENYYSHLPKTSQAICISHRGGALLIFAADLMLCLPKSRPSFAPALKDSADASRRKAGRPHEGKGAAAFPCCGPFSLFRCAGRAGLDSILHPARALSLIVVAVVIILLTA